MALDYADKSLKQEKEIILEAVKKDGYTLNSWLEYLRVGELPFTQIKEHQEDLHLILLFGHTHLLAFWKLALSPL